MSTGATGRPSQEERGLPGLGVEFIPAEFWQITCQNFLLHLESINEIGL